MAGALAEFRERARKSHEASVRRGEHDELCEHDVEGGFLICHCSKRRREAEGFTKPPTEDLYFPPPDCPRCNQNLYHDGDAWCCDPCSLTWSSNGDGRSASFTDDYGDLSRKKERHGS